MRLALALTLLGAIPAGAQEPRLPPGEKEPFFRLEARGPTSYVTALAFSPDGKLLYAAGWDKVVRVWKLDDKTGQFVLDEQTAYRVPIGPGLDGSINAIALSPDGTWLAVGGNDVVRGMAGFRSIGKVFDRRVMTPTMRQDQGTIFVFDTRMMAGGAAVHILRGHLGSVVSLAFAQLPAGQSPVLISAAREWDEQEHWIGSVRLWDLKQEKSLGRVDPFPDLQEIQMRPGLACWSSQDGRLKAAIAWGDGPLRLWDVDGKSVPEVADGKANNTAALLSGRLVTGSFRARSGRLTIWDVSGEQPAQLESTALANVDPQTFVAPRGLSLFSSRPGEPPDHAAVAVQQSDNDPAYRLRILRRNGQSWTEVRDLPLWPGAKRAALAASSGHVAVAGGASHQILVYSVADLLDGTQQRVEPQRLQGVGTTFRQVAFAAKGGHLGLLLSSRRKGGPGLPADAPGPGESVFDLSGGKLLGDSGGWERVGPVQDGWKVQLRRNEQGQIRELAAVDPAQGQALPWIRVKSGQVVTDYAVLPHWLPPQVPVLAMLPTSHFLLPLFGQPRAPFQIPLLAVATHEDGEPYLTLYNAASGEAVRRYAGHGERLHALAFSPDGRLLASVSDDQTVSVWSLADLDQVLGRRGRLPGMNVKNAPGGQGVAVDDFDEGPTADTGLAPGDVIEGRILAGSLQRLNTPFDFTQAIWRSEPGTTVELQVRGKPNVRLRVGQGMDVRNPLFSLFITRPIARAAQEWIGWSPMGPYDTSGQAAENYLGWHFNTGDAAAPTRFALAKEYHDTFYRPGLLPQLVDEKRPPSPRRPEPRPAPRMVLWLEQPGAEPARTDERGQILIREPRGSLHLAVRNYPRDKIDDWVGEVRWQIDGGPARAFDPLTQWSADLEKHLSSKRGIHTLRVTLRTQEEQPREFSSDLVLRYQPRAPTVVLKPSLRNLTVNQPALVWEMDVAPGVAAEAVKVRLVQSHASKGQIKEESYVLLKEGEIKQPLDLEPGANEVLAEAANRDALAGFEDLETTRQSWVANYLKPREEAPPRIILRVVPLNGGQATESGSDRPLVVHAPKVRIEGTIKAADGAGPLQLADWSHGKAECKSLARFAAGKDREWTFTREEELSPGADNVFHLRSKTANSPVAEVSLSLDYRPLLPEAVFLQPADGQFFYEGKDAREVPFEVRLVWPADPQPCRAVLVVGGKEIGKPQALEKGAASWTGKLSLGFGSNSIQVRLSNDWQASATSEASQVRYLRPPRITELSGPSSSRAPLVDLQAKIVSVSQPERPVLLVHGERKGVDAGPPVKVEGQPDVWSLALKEVPLEVGDNPIALSIRNADGECLEPASRSVRYEPTPAPPAPPEVEILAPASGDRTTEEEVMLSLRIKSARQPTHVEVVREGDRAAALVLAVGPDRLKPAGEGVYEVKLPVPLVPGLNALLVNAANEGGQRSSNRVEISYSRVPIQVLIDGIEAWNNGDGAVRPAGADIGSHPLRLDVAGGRVWLLGRIRGRRDNDEELRKIKGLWVYVNDIRQLPADVGPLSRNTRERRFRVPLVLNGKDNHIVLETINVIQDANNRSEFKVACDQPEKSQRLHLIIVGSDSTDVKDLRERALQAVNAPRTATTTFTTPAFQAGFIDGPLTTFVTGRRVFSTLIDVRRRINELDSKGPPVSDVIMFFYQGRETSDSRDSFHWSEESWNEMRNVFAATPGAQVLFLDVTRDQGGAAENDSLSGSSRIGVLHYAWLGPTAPPDARLMTALEDTMPRSPRLGDLESQVDEKLAQMGKTYSKFIQYREYLPDDLKSLVINTKKRFE
jgi:WD40 repeat protein